MLKSIEGRIGGLSDLSQGGGGGYPLGGRGISPTPLAGIQEGGGGNLLGSQPGEKPGRGGGGGGTNLALSAGGPNPFTGGTGPIRIACGILLVLCDIAAWWTPGGGGGISSILAGPGGSGGNLCCIPGPEDTSITGASEKS